MSLTIPTQPNMPAHTDDLKTLVDESVNRFALELGPLQAMARMNGWLEKYRFEVERVTNEAYRRGRQDQYAKR